jgi:hypothetical protein
MGNFGASPPTGIPIGLDEHYNHYTYKIADFGRL